MAVLTEAELREMLRVAAITAECQVTFVENMKADDIDWRRIPRRYRDRLEGLAVGGTLDAKRIRDALART